MTHTHLSRVGVLLSCIFLFVLTADIASAESFEDFQKKEKQSFMDFIRGGKKKDVKPAEPAAPPQDKTGAGTPALSQDDAKMQPKTAQTEPIDRKKVRDAFQKRLNADIIKIREILARANPQNRFEPGEEEINKKFMTYFMGTQRGTLNTDYTYYKVLGQLIEDAGYYPNNIIGNLRGESADAPEFNYMSLSYTYETDHFCIKYSKGDIERDADINDITWAAKNPPDKDTQTLNFSGIPLYVMDVGRFLEIFREKYISKGYKYPGWDADTQTQSPEKLNVLIDSTMLTSTHYNALTGSLNVNPSGLFQFNVFKQTLAHELFHAVQKEYFNIFQYKLTGRTWWLEASAEYAGYMIGNDGNGPGPKQISRTYPKYSITYNEILGQNDHAYATGWFVDYIVRHGAVFQDMWNATVNAEWLDMASVLEPLNRYLKDKTAHDLPWMYQEFMKEVVFSQTYIKNYELNSPPVEKDNIGETVTAWIQKDGDERRQIFYPHVDPDYTSAVYGIIAKPLTGKTTRNLKLSYTRSPLKGTTVYIYKLVGNKRSQAYCIATFSHSDSPPPQPITVSLEENDGLYVLAVNTLEVVIDFELIIDEADTSSVRGSHRLNISLTGPLVMKYSQPVSGKDTQLVYAITIDTDVFGPLEWSGNSFYINKTIMIGKLSRTLDISGSVDPTGSKILTFKASETEKREDEDPQKKGELDVDCLTSFSVKDVPFVRNDKFWFTQPGETAHVFELNNPGDNVSDVSIRKKNSSLKSENYVFTGFSDGKPERVQAVFSNKAE